MTHPFLPVLLSLAIGSGSFVVLTAKYVEVVRTLQPASASVEGADLSATQSGKEGAGLKLDPTNKSENPPKKENPDPGPQPIGPGNGGTDPPPPNPDAPPPTIAAVNDQTLELGEEARIHFDVGRPNRPAKVLSVSATSTASWLQLKVEGTDVKRTVTVTPGWTSGAATVTLTVADTDGKSARREFKITVGPKRLPDGINWKEGEGKVLVLVAASKLNRAELATFRVNVGKIKANHKRLLGGDVFVVGSMKVWRADTWDGSDVFEGANPDETFATTFKTVGEDLDSIRGRREPKAFFTMVPWHSLTTPEKIPERLVELKEARLYWTGEIDTIQDKNKPTAALFGSRVNGLGTDLTALGTAVNDYFQK